FGRAFFIPEGSTEPARPVASLDVRITANAAILSLGILSGGSLSESSAMTLVEAGWVVPVTPSGSVLADHAVVIGGDRIVDVLPVAAARQRYSGARRIELPGHLLIPGLVNLHTHAAMTLMRG